MRRGKLRTPRRGRPTPRILPARVGRRDKPRENSNRSKTGLCWNRRDRMIVVQHWDSVGKVCRSCGVDALPAKASDIKPDDVWWIDLSEPTPEEEEQILGRFFPV